MSEGDDTGATMPGGHGAAGTGSGLSRRRAARLAAVAAAGLAAGRVPAGVRAKKQKNVITVCPTCTYTTVQQAISAAPVGSTIRVAKGTYSGAVVVDRSLTIRGAGQTKTTLTRTYGDGEYGSVILLKGVTATIRNLTVTGGKATDPTGPFTDGGGILAISSNLTVQKCTVTGNASRDYGGGICSRHGTLILDQVDLTDNTSNYGGGLSVLSGQVTVSGGRVAGNAAVSPVDSGGGGASVEFSNLDATGWIVESNSSDHAGGGLYIGGTAGVTTAVLTGCTISSNSAGEQAGGIFVRYCTFTTQDRGGKRPRPTVVEGNSADRGGGLVLGDAVTATLSGRSSISGNTASDSGGGVCIVKTVGTALTLADRSSISGNTATSTSTPPKGGGIRMLSGTVTLEGKGSVTGNSATGSGAVGGGIYRDAGTVAGNTANVKNNTPDDIDPPV